MISSPLETLHNLQTHNHSHLLDVIDELRGQGLSNFLPLPQLIVCGDQSSGKSSVLEAISGVPFPKKDTLCTRFATEVVLRRSSSKHESKVSVSILPGQDRSETDQANLRNFSRALADVRELPETIELAKTAMGLGSQGSNAFFTDVLRLEVTGPRLPQLTIVDLPGLIHSETKMQTKQDVELVSKLVKSYMIQERSIILAVISAKNDIPNQIVLDRAREADPTGQRTLGIITKPDLLRHNSTNEAAFLNLARNLDVVFKLGWHAVRNLDTHEVAEQADHDRVETAFFSNSNWRALTTHMLGATSLRKRLSTVLFDQISRELPKLMLDIEKCRVECQDELDRLGRTRSTETEQRMFLIELHQKTIEICHDGCNGNYDDSFFRLVDSRQQLVENKRLRAVIQNSGLEFAQAMKRQGARWIVVANTDARNIKNSKTHITRHDAIAHVVLLLRKSRGRELPSTFNPMLISELFHKYSAPWKSIAEGYVYTVWQKAKTFIDLALQHVADESVSEMYTRLVLYPEMDTILTTANKALDSLFSEMDRHASTFNDRFLKNIVEEETERKRAELETKLRAVFAERKTLSIGDVNWLVFSLLSKPSEDMDQTAAEDILNKMQGYYKICLERFVDNVPSDVVERVIVTSMLDLFRPARVLTMNTDLVQQIAGETAEKEAYRQSLTSKLAILQTGEGTCKRYAAQVDDIDSTSRDTVVLTPAKSIENDSSSEPGSASTESNPATQQYKQVDFAGPGNHLEAKPTISFSLDEPEEASVPESEQPAAGIETDLWEFRKSLKPVKGNKKKSSSIPLLSEE